MEQRAQEHAGDLPEHMGADDAEDPDEVIRRSEVASEDKKLTKDGFGAFARLLGIPVSDTNRQCSNSNWENVNRLARTYEQNQF
jgi:hypothetical protein